LGMSSASSSGDSGVLPSPVVKTVIASSLFRKPNRLGLNGLFEIAASVILQRHRMFDPEDVCFGCGAHARIPKLLESARARYKGVDEFAFKCAGEGAEALEARANFRLWEECQVALSNNHIETT
jgi:hypothetical protein